jgi:hypothetical protein
MSDFSQGGKVAPMTFSDLGKALVTIDLTPIYQAAAEVNRAAATLSKLASDGGLTQYLEQLRIDNGQKERDRRWRDDPLQLKARYLDPLVAHFREQTVQVLEWMVERVKG